MIIATPTSLHLSGISVLNKIEPIVAYICPYRKPLDFIALKNKDGKTIRGFFKEQKDKIPVNKENGEFIEDDSYSGCPYWNKPKIETDDFL